MTIEMPWSKQTKKMAKAVEGESRSIKHGFYWSLERWWWQQRQWPRHWEDPCYASSDADIDLFR